jgi:hypothetical protein
MLEQQTLKISNKDTTDLTTKVICNKNAKSNLFFTIFLQIMSKLLTEKISVLSLDTYLKMMSNLSIWQKLLFSKKHDCLALINN